MNSKKIKEYTYIDLFNRMIDLEGLSILPEEGSKCQQWSSYNRVSRYDPETDKYFDWGANMDGGGYIRDEGEDKVLAEMEGPGVIWRIWSARAKLGNIKIFIDDNPEPVVKMPFREIFDPEKSPFAGESFTYKVTPDPSGVEEKAGFNVYFPIPFKKYCKITGEPDWGRFYHFNYETFPEGTIVPEYKDTFTEKEMEVIAKVDDFLTNKLGADPKGHRRYEKVIEETFEIEPGKTAVIADITGKRAITSFYVTPLFENKDDREDVENAMRELSLSMYWDNEEKPSVWSPLGDFFGSCPGINEYKSLPLGMTDGAFYSLWYMPFESRGEINISNDGNKTRILKIRIMYSPLEEDGSNASKYGRFHAKWHRDVFLPKEPERWMDWTILKTEGRGRFLGTMLHIWNPYGVWWGEGDEKFYIDGEKFPSTFGTGSEDYFGYAWGYPDYFSKPYHSQTYNQYRNAGSVSVNRWHISDNIPFSTSFFGTIEKYFPRPDKNEEGIKRLHEACKYAAIAYWYLEPRGVDEYEPLTLKERMDYYSREIPVFRAEGAIECEDLEFTNTGGGTSKIQARPEGPVGAVWSNNKQVLWYGGEPGDRIDFQIPVESPGKYELIVQLSKTKDYGIFNAYFKGVKVMENIDLYNPNLVEMGETSLGIFDLNQGKHSLQYEIVGCNPLAENNYYFGIDYIKLIQVG